MIRRLLLAVLIIVTVSACTPRQVRQWTGWFRTDPQAALEFARRPEVQASLAASRSDGPQFEQWEAGQGVRRGDCASYAPLFAAYGLPVATFKAIAWRESGCDHTRFSADRDDLGGYLLGINFRTDQLRRGWLSWCGATLTNARYDPERQVRCAAEAYHRLGLSPWR